VAVEDPNHVRLFLGLHAAWRRTNNNLCVRNQSGQQIQLNIQKLVPPSTNFFPGTGGQIRRS
jgi:hypothetical protein